MYISKLVLTNFRSFSGRHELDFSSGINFLVGNNNSGKTTIFKAIEFLSIGKNSEDYITNNKENDFVSVELTFSGDDIPDIVNDEALKKYKNYIFDDNGTKNIKICRSSKKDSITQNGRSKELGIKNVRTWKQDTKQYENPTGIDTTISALFEAQFVYSDLKNEDYQDFGKTKIVGKLINAITSDFQQSKEYEKLRIAHKAAFGEKGLLLVLKNTQNKIQDIMYQQYGAAKVEFNFGIPEMESFFKSGNISLTDSGGSTTDISQKGTGMQRALAMSLIQVYSEVVNSDNSRQLLFFIDEPETFLHPQAQDRLINSFERISQNSQVFITTHSPYLLKKFNSENQEIKIFSPKPLQGEKVVSGKKIDTFPFSPTWGEINYFAFDVISVEFHNELFGYLQDYSERWREKEIDKWLANQGKELSIQGLLQNVSYTREKDGKFQSPENKTLPTFVRNIIHHPENKNNEYTPEQLRESIESMVALITKLKNK